MERISARARSRVGVFALCAAALVGFAANSLLCRLALRPRLIDAATFTAIRLASGALILSLLAAVAARRGGPAASSPVRAGSWWSAIALFVYAAPFSFAYLRLGAGVGALLLFGAVQATMIGWGLVRGERPRAIEWIGLVIALAGLVVLNAPGASAPDPIGAVSMIGAGIAWGVYSLRGKGAIDPLASTAGNFVRATPMAGVLVAIVVVAAADLHASPHGALLAASSGAIASGVGYTLWYAALRHITSIRAAIVQLSVPVLTAIAAVAILDEPITTRLIAGGAAILGGVALTLRPR